MNTGAVVPAAHDIAVVGMSGRFPGAMTIDQFWENLREGKESISFFSEAEIPESEVHSEIVGDTNYVRAAGILGNVDQFDAEFFGYSPREAEVMDPQQRIFLEVAWHALEDAGYVQTSPETLVGVYAGCAISTYLIHNVLANREVSRLSDGFQLMVGNDKDYLATRVSYKLNLKGPSISVQTACSTSLVAVCVACQGLISYDCDIALAGGVSIKVPERSGYLYQVGSILSPDGHCRPFDSAAQGTVRGNGVGIVVLKRLEDALRDRDSIRAIIKGWAVNNDGSQKVGYTAPSIDGQADVIAMAQALSKVDPASISYIEAHGTATQLGDPIEISALSQAFGSARPESCAIGSVKSNIGHLDPAAGIAGLIKTILALEHKQIPPSLHYRSPNPRIDFHASAFQVNNRLTEWTNGALPRRAGVSSFGIGGTNAHVILEEAPIRPASSEVSNASSHLLILSARSPALLDQATANLAHHLNQEPAVDLADVTYTLQVGRKPFNHRRLAVCRDRTDALAALVDPSRMLSGEVERGDPKIAFLFPGQGTQHINMFRELFEQEPVFAREISRCARALEPRIKLDLLSVLYPPPNGSPGPGPNLDDTALSQPALFVVEYALATLWMSWGIRPQAMLGQSIGEYVAACLAGVVSLDDALDLVAERARLMQEMPAGAMLAVFASEVSIRPRLQDSALSIAALNSPGSCVVSGPKAALEAFASEVSQAGISVRYLRTSHAFHSSMMDPVVKAFVNRAVRVHLSPPCIPYISNVTGTWMEPGSATDPSYWGSHLRQPVRFADGIRCLVQCGCRLLLEVGPGNQLANLARQNLPSPGSTFVVSSARDPRKPGSDQAAVHQALGRVWLTGASIDWDSVNANRQPRRISLPPYPFEPTRYWIEPTPVVLEPAGVGTNPFPVDQGIALDDCFRTPAWRAKPLRNPAGIHAKEKAQGWLVFAEKNNLSVRLVKRLEQLGRHPVVATRGTQYSRAGEGEYVIDPGEPEHYVRLLEDLRCAGLGFSRIFYLWPTAQEWPGQRVGVHDLNFYGLIYLAQSIGNSGVTGPVRIGVVSSGLHAISARDRLDAHQATLLGPCRVIPQEYRHIGCKSIDVNYSALERLPIDSIAAELSGFDSPLVAYRDGHRLVQGYVPTTLKPVSFSSRRLRTGGTYLITGGLGGIGLAIAGALAEQFQAKLVLTGRSKLPLPEDWQGWLSSHDPSDRVSGKIRQLQSLQSRGAEVLALSADVCDRDQMRRVFEQTMRRFGKLHGVIHSAGVPGDDLIQFTTMASAEKVFAPKITGTEVIASLVRDLPIDFLALFSSLASVVGGVGLASYCSANAFLDAYASSQCRKPGPFTVSINWPTWKEVGMSVNALVPPGMEQSRQEGLQLGLTSSEGVEIFLRILSSDVRQVAIAPFRRTTAAEQGNHHTSTPNAAPPGASLSGHARPRLSNQYCPPQTELEMAIASVWEEVLGFEKIGINDNFFALGGHSLLAIKVISRLRDILKRDVSVVSVLSALTIAELAKALEEPAADSAAEMKEELALLEQLTDEEAEQLLAKSS
jgi:acyl transferase domain-containing protein